MCNNTEIAVVFIKWPEIPSLRRENIHAPRIKILKHFLKDFICLFDRQRSQVSREAGRER